MKKQVSKKTQRVLDISKAKKNITLTGKPLDAVQIFAKTK